MDVVDASDRDHRLHQILAAYYEADETGDAPDRRILIERHPDLAADLAEFFASQDRVRELAAPFRASGGRTGGPARSSMMNGGDTAFDAGAVFGDYEILGEIAHGGMGVVYRARQRGLDRLVALKVLRDGAGADPDDARRFCNEAGVVASLDHPSIVPIYEVGEHRGARFFSMKLVDGGSLADRAEEYTADPRRAARLMADVARAIEYAHGRGILHRDLKPSNILVDDRGRPQVADFGLARRLDGDDDLTRTGLVLGTPSYMAPEQAGGPKGSVTTATDVHGLGSILYFLLTGRPPFGGASALDILDRVRSEPPRPPSTIRRAVNRDLETICLKCLEKDPGRRYRSAAEFADDLERWLAGQPIVARRVGPAERAWRLCRGHPRMAILAASALLLLVTSVLGLFREAEANKAALGLDREARRSRRAILSEQYARDVKQAYRYWGANRRDDALSLLERHRPAAGEDDLRGFAWSYLSRLCTADPAGLRGHRGEVYFAAFSPDGKTLATASQDRTVRLWDPRTGETRLILRGHGDEVNWVSWAPDGRTLATASDDKTVKLWDARTGRETNSLNGHPEPVVAALFSPDGKRLISGSRGGTIISWDAATPSDARRFDLPERDLQSLAISPDGKKLAIAVGRGLVCNVEDGRVVARLEADLGQVRTVDFSRDGATLAIGGLGGGVELRETRTWTRTAFLPTREPEIESLHFATDDRSLTAVGPQGTIYLWDRATGARETIASGQARLWCVTPSPDGRILATTSKDATVKLWDLRRDRPRISLSVPTASSACVEFSSQGDTITVADARARAWIFDAHTGRLKTTNRFDDGSPTLFTSLSRDAGLLATARADGTVTLRELPTGRVLKDITGPPSEQHLFISPTGQWVARSQGQTTLALWKVRHGGRVLLQGPEAGRLIFSPREDSFSIWRLGQSTPTLWDVPSGSSRRATRPGHKLTIVSQAFSGDGTILATGGDDGTVILWDTRSLEPITEMSGPSTGIESLAFSPDGRTLATGGRDGLVRLWDIATGRELATLEGHTWPVIRARFSPDGLTLATCAEIPGGGTELFLWPVEPPR